MSGLMGPFTLLPRPPMNRGGVIDPFEQEKWFTRIWYILSAAGGIAWDIVNKKGSKLSDLEFRTHIMLQSVLGADATNTGKEIEDVDHVKHVSDQQSERWEDGASAAFCAEAELLMLAVPQKRESRPSYEGLALMGGM